MPNQSRKVAYGRVHNLQIVSITSLAPRKDGYWVMYKVPELNSQLLQLTNPASSTAEPGETQ
jgi:hypothetical protein